MSYSSSLISIKLLLPSLGFIRLLRRVRVILKIGVALEIKQKTILRVLWLHVFFALPKRSFAAEVFIELFVVFGTFDERFSLLRTEAAKIGDETYVAIPEVMGEIYKFYLDATQTVLSLKICY